MKPSSVVWASAVPKYVSPLAILHFIYFTYSFHQNSSAPVGATSGAYAYTTNSSSDQYEQFTFADGDVYPASLEFMTPPSCADWACCSPTTESSLAIAPGAGVGAVQPKSPDTGAVRSFGPTPLPIPLALQHTTTTSSSSSSALHEIPAALWGTGYAGSAAAAFGGAAPGLTANYAEAAVPVPAAGYDVAASQVGLDEFINAL